MFSRGSRFPASKGNDVPGPGAYDTQDPEFDAYKRGAFLEKTNRFDKDKPSDVPGPGAYDTELNAGQNRPPTRTSNTSPTDRLAILQRKLEELEQVHIEGKKAHHLEQERLKLELSRAQRAAAEQTERAEKSKKQNEALDARLQELKKTTAAEQAELRELRVKLRASEHERTQLAAKQGDAAEARKVEARRKEELRERDRKLADLEKALVMEKKKREGLEARLQEAKAKTDERVQQALAAAENVERKWRAAEKEAQDARDALQQLESRAEDTEEELVAQLEQHRSSLARVAEEYGRLASTTVCLTEHQRVKHEFTALQLRNNRLERKLANSDAQVVELASLIRQTKEECAFLATQVRDAQEEADTYRSSLYETSRAAQSLPDNLQALAADAAAVFHEQRALDLDVCRAIQSDLEQWATLDSLQKDALLFHASVLIKDLTVCRAQLVEHEKQLAEAEGTRTQLSEALARAQAEHAEGQRLLAESAASMAESNVRIEALKKELQTIQADKQVEVARAEQSLQEEKQARQQLAKTLAHAKQTEQFLRAEVEQLGSDLADAEKYEEAYNGLLAEVDALVAKNSLAEDEAQRLSKFNAEILGHNNPAQRIVYMDRVRRELHETKQKLLLSTRDREAVLADNDELRAELEMYKSVAVPQDAKPRTAIIRITRLGAPTTLDANYAASASRLPDHTQTLSSLRSMSGSRLTSVPEATSGDMTLDEIV
ncbi:hypothetical protein C8Q80DRAFT_1185421 [Daedaleopsis nitida]|nr:hypothetical protein C8Q80DRAFT_1185421 [Daedaleopsis nitida]